LELKFGNIGFEVDLAAQEVIAAERTGRKIAIEIKSFLGRSVAHDFHQALGQFLNYQMILETIDPERILYLGVPNNVFQSFFATPFAKAAVQKHAVSLLVFDPEIQEVKSWINSSTTEI
jgi:hypothetical protein